MDNFFAGWFVEFSKGLNKLNDGECGRLFADCGKTFAGFETLVPGRKFNIQKMESILGGNNLCRFRISFEE